MEIKQDSSTKGAKCGFAFRKVVKTLRNPVIMEGIFLVSIIMSKEKFGGFKNVSCICWKNRGKQQIISNILVRYQNIMYICSRKANVNRNGLFLAVDCYADR